MTDANDGSHNGADTPTGTPPIGESQPKDPVPSKPATEADLREVEKKMSGFERSTLRWTRASFIVVLATGVFICLQWLEIRSGGKDTHDLAVAAGKQADKMTNMSDAADKIRQASEGMVTQEQRLATNGENTLKETSAQSKKTLDATVKQFSQEQRAWVGVEGTSPSEGFTETELWRITIIFFNSGRTPARNVRASMAFLTSTVPTQGPPSEDIEKLSFRAVQSIAPQGSFRFSLGKEFSGEPTSGIQKEGTQTLLSLYKPIKDRRVFLYYFGILKYEDIFGNERETQFCIFLANPDTKEVGMCDSFNDLK